MDAILSQPNAWIFIDPNNLEDLKIPKCADQFVRLLDAIRERYCNLPQPGHQLQFLNLQLELIEAFRQRLVDLHGDPDENVTTTMVLNAINYLNSVLREWGENVVSTLNQHLNISRSTNVFIYFRTSSTIYIYMRHSLDLTPMR